MTHTEAIAAMADGTHVLDGFGSRGRIVEMSGEEVARVKWIGEGDRPVRVHISLIRSTAETSD